MICLQRRIATSQPTLPITDPINVKSECCRIHFKVMNFGMDVTVNTATCNGCQTIGLMSWSVQRLPDNRIVETVARQSDGSCKDDTKTILPTAYEPTLEPNGYGRVQSFDLLLDSVYVRV